ncbi:unnamed protein product [Phytophthora lilii]|uniref:Unnamed protein product n=1 Tax=Phytophthora lilii TaxID=2077276 RepID=A0A9W6XKW9_9STRA|nr:unnamed protein product [Phytophthora lilii]
MWHDLPNRRANVNRENVVAFYSTPDCTAPDVKVWTVKIQSSAEANFPSKFELDGLENSISSFNVISAGGGKEVKYIWGVTERLSARNTSMGEIGPTI